MSIFQETIHELIQYKKGDIIPLPDEFIELDKFLSKKVIISRRSFTHILQKEKVGFILINSINKCLNNFDSIFLSDKGKNNTRLIILKNNIAVVIELNKNNDNVSVVTAMTADVKYLTRKYKKLR